MCLLLGCKEASLPVKYLGIYLKANPRLVKTWKPVIDKVEDKLSMWKAKTLNKAGKLVLIKSVLNSMPIYYLSKMPKAMAKKLIFLQRYFLWSKDDGRYGMPLVKWELVMAQKRQPAYTYERGSMEGYLPITDKETVLQAEALQEDITSYSFTSAIWSGILPPRIELFAWFVLVGRVNTKDRLCAECLTIRSREELEDARLTKATL
ncbi:uncharacterized protein LOC107494925 [Arachis duranensis]|uniref:Uncharacterized protein LOC107494925 n=1 Tax=Arachis duranensis TaxID=130453 RepID=A0A6P4DSD7_ARADU|nr:uncharacterized protein LOC107494925 [Arachis duranensis]